ncbi:MAG: hypothetical protein GY679_01155 [Mycoplasma sp.]|nr:hypothetical protein [Mycoplasma sp.]
MEEKIYRSWIVTGSLCYSKSNGFYIGCREVADKDSLLKLERKAIELDTVYTEIRENDFFEIDIYHTKEQKESSIEELKKAGLDRTKSWGDAFWKERYYIENAKFELSHWDNLKDLGLEDEYLVVYKNIETEKISFELIRFPPHKEISREAILCKIKRRLLNSPKIKVIGVQKQPCDSWIYEDFFKDIKIVDYFLREDCFEINYKEKLENLFVGAKEFFDGDTLSEEGLKETFLYIDSLSSVNKENLKRTLSKEGKEEVEKLQEEQKEFTKKGQTEQALVVTKKIQQKQNKMREVLENQE